VYRFFSRSFLTANLIALFDPIAIDTPKLPLSLAGCGVNQISLIPYALCRILTVRQLPNFIDLKIIFLARPTIHSIEMSRSNLYSTLSVGKSDVRLTPVVWKSLRHSSSNSAWTIKNSTVIG
jgi:hypothetical protein